MESEIEKLKFAYGMVKSGSSIRNVLRQLFDRETVGKKERLKLTTVWGRFLRHQEYTGHSLNMEGLSILHAYARLEIDTLSALRDRKYWAKSVPYPLELITIDEWVETAERLYLNTRNVLASKKRRVGKALCTGLIKCSCCGVVFYAYFVKYEKKDYRYYKHVSVFNGSDCTQRPRSLSIASTDTMFELFYFYYYLVFDDTKRVVEESLRDIEKQRTKAKERLADAERRLKKIDGNLKNHEIAMDGADPDTIRILIRRIDAFEREKTECVSDITSSKIEIEKLNEKYSGTELRATYYSVKDRLVDFHEKFSVMQKRDELLRVIKNSELFGRYLTIVAGKKLFVFDTKERHRFGVEYLDKLKNDEVYLDNFLGMEKLERLEAFMYKDRIVSDWVLDSEYRGTAMREIIGDFLLERGVGTNLTDVDEVVSFIETGEYTRFLTEHGVLRHIGG